MYTLLNNLFSFYLPLPYNVHDVCPPMLADCTPGLNSVITTTPVAEILKRVQTFAPGANAFAPGANALHLGQIRYPRGKPGGIVFAPGVNYLPPDKIEGASFCPAKVSI